MFVQRYSSCCHAFQPTRPTLFDVPLSPYGARVRYCIYKYGLEDVVDIRPPSDLGGVKSEEYMALHPAGKMPLLVLPSGQGIPESAVSCERPTSTMSLRHTFISLTILMIGHADMSCSCWLPASASPSLINAGRIETYATEPRCRPHPSHAATSYPLFMCR